jgi:hypothetical protein
MNLMKQIFTKKQQTSTLPTNTCAKPAVSLISENAGQPKMEMKSEKPSDRDVLNDTRRVVDTYARFSLALGDEVLQQLRRDSADNPRAQAHILAISERREMLARALDEYHQREDASVRTEPPSKPEIEAVPLSKRSKGLRLSTSA